ncbi:RHOMBOID-like protein 9, chloroplastic isoform X1 [Ricinus communis]|uniref:RHOMBOID-like protein 9, chloroplastic isoform X1 n=2 Tax=Ricinus communis TaxID=3988 RepID=UPI00201A24FD|nr:RHOMBOID-like protein 9, chloroplastic isoform X1 [Ricinus communis]
MAVVPVCYKMPYKNHLLTSQHSVRQHERSLVCLCLAFPQGCIFSDTRKSWQVICPTADILLKRKMGGLNASKGAFLNQGTSNVQNMTEASAVLRVWSMKGENSSMGSHASKTSINEKQLRLLDSYFGKLQGDANQPSTDSSDETTKLGNKSKEINPTEELQSLNSYLDKLSKDSNLENYVSSTSDDLTTESEKLVSVYEDSKRGEEEKPKSFVKLREKDANRGLRRSQALQQNDETSDLYLTSILVSINIAVFLFELASPVRNSEFELFTLPLLYGAKINDLILVGEWWRLLTPMFLHSGVFHMALGCWSLLTFGPQVSRGYGSFTFVLIFILGGISGNLTSFLHTPEPTVGGTGPIFAIIGAWLVFQMQNKDVIAKDISESMFQKAIIITGLSFILSHFEPIDDWTHLGATLTGIVYGYFTCPTLQLDNASSRSGQDEGVAFVRGYANSCKSLILFAVLIVLLISLLFFIEPPLDTLEPDDLAWFWKQDAIP